MPGTRDEIAREYGTAIMARAFTPLIEDYFRTTTMFGLGWE